MMMVFLMTSIAHSVTVGNLRCEYRKDPLGIDVAKPRFSWVLDAGRQTAYQIVVGDTWDSGKIASDQSVNVGYTGKPLMPGTSYQWKVKIWDAEGKESDWAEAASFSTGLHEWQAKWIGFDFPEQDSPFHTRGLHWVHVVGGKTELRKSFELPAGRKVRRAVLALYADNECKASLNGVIIGNAVKWEQTARLDLTSGLRSGKNVISLAPRQTDNLSAAAIGRLVVQFDAGEDWQLPLDATWENARPSGNTPWGTPSLNDQPRVPASYLRKEFDIAKKVKRAMVYVTALGAYELHLNGRRVGRDELTPGWTEFHKRVDYQTYDVTGQVLTGKNALGAILGDGWYASDLAFTGKRNFYGGKPKLLAQMVVEFADGSSQTIVTDGSWKASYGPILHADLMIGCEYDARLEMPGWDTSGFDENKWSPARETEALTGSTADVTSVIAAAVKDGHVVLKIENDTLGGDPAPLTVKSLSVDYQVGGKGGSLTLAEHAVLDLSGPDLRIVRARYGKSSDFGPSGLQAVVADASRRHEELSAVKCSEPKPGVYIYDLGQNMVGWTKLRLRGQGRPARNRALRGNAEPRWHALHLRTCAVRPRRISLSWLARVWRFWSRMFTFHGFRYVELRGLGRKAGPWRGDGRRGAFGNGPDRFGFECSSPLVNRLYA